MHRNKVTSLIALVAWALLAAAARAEPPVSAPQPGRDLARKIIDKLKEKTLEELVEKLGEKTNMSRVDRDILKRCATGLPDLKPCLIALLTTVGEAGDSGEAAKVQAERERARVIQEFLRGGVPRLKKMAEAAGTRRAGLRAQVDQMQALRGRCNAWAIGVQQGLSSEADQLSAQQRAIAARVAQVRQTAEAEARVIRAETEGYNREAARLNDAQRRLLDQARSESASLRQQVANNNQRVRASRAQAATLNQEQAALRTLVAQLNRLIQRWNAETGHPHYTSRECWCAPATVPYHQGRRAA